MLRLCIESSAWAENLGIRLSLSVFTIILFSVLGSGHMDRRAYCWESEKERGEKLGGSWQRVRLLSCRIKAAGLKVRGGQRGG